MVGEQGSEAFVVGAHDFERAFENIPTLPS